LDGSVILDAAPTSAPTGRLYCERDPYPVEIAEAALAPSVACGGMAIAEYLNCMANDREPLDDLDIRYLREAVAMIRALAVDAAPAVALEDRLSALVANDPELYVHVRGTVDQYGRHVCEATSSEVTVASPAEPALAMSMLATRADYEAAKAAPPVVHGAFWIDVVDSPYGGGLNFGCDFVGLPRGRYTLTAERGQGDGAFMSCSCATWDQRRLCLRNRECTVVTPLGATP